MEELVPHVPKKPGLFSLLFVAVRVDPHGELARAFRRFEHEKETAVASVTELNMKMIEQEKLIEKLKKDVDDANRICLEIEVGTSNEETENFKKKLDAVDLEKKQLRENVTEQRELIKKLEEGTSVRLAIDVHGTLDEETLANYKQDLEDAKKALGEAESEKTRMRREATDQKNTLTEKLSEAEETIRKMRANQEEIEKSLQSKKAEEEVRAEKRKRDEAADKAAAAAAEAAKAEARRRSELAAAAAEAAKAEARRQSELAAAALAAEKRERNIAYKEALTRLQTFVLKRDECTDEDARKFYQSWKEYFKSSELFVSKDDTNFKRFMENSNDLLDDSNLKLWTDVYDTIVRKKGNVRMMLRFNNKRQSIERYGKDKAFFLKSLDAEKKKAWFGIWVENDAVFIDKEMWTMKDTTISTKMRVRFRKIFDASKRNKAENSFEEAELKFERIFTLETQAQVYDDVQPFIISALEGKSVALIAYGGTGSGKTYTMGTEVSASATVSDEIDEKDGIFIRLIRALISRKVAFEIQVVEIVPSVEQRKVGISHRVFDLADTSISADPRFTKRGLKFYTPKGLKVFETCSYKNPSGSAKTSETNVNWYKAHNGLNDCQPGTQNSVHVPENFEKLTFSGDVKLGDVKKQYFACVKKRRTDVTLGNNGKSSRTHLLTTISIKMTDKGESKVFLLDLAGKESKLLPAKSERDEGNNELTEGINKSLDVVLKLIEEKKRRKKIELPRKGSLVDNEFAYLSTVKNPIEVLMKEIWTQPDSKIMLLACGYPFAATEVTTDEIDLAKSWQKHLDLQEDPILKLSRDCGIYKRLSDIQKVVGGH